MYTVKSLIRKVTSKFSNLYHKQINTNNTAKKNVYRLDSPSKDISKNIDIEYKPLSEFDYTKYPLRLNLGCGFDIRPSYLNVDFQEFHNPDLVADIRKLDVLPSEVYEEILAQDCLEHFSRCDAEPTLVEWSRLLKCGGILKLRVPNVIGLLELFNWESKQSVEDQKTLVQCLYGTQAYNGDWHLNGFTKVLLEHYLDQAGFCNIEFDSLDHWLFEVVCEKKSL